MYKYDQILSLGYSCNIQNLCNTTTIFTNVASSVWGINKLLVNDFKDIGVDVKLRELFDNTSKRFLVDTKYGLRYYMESNNMPSMDKLKENLSYRVMKTRNILLSDKSVLFIRYEEPMFYKRWGNRLVLSEEYKKSEYTYLLEFVDIMSRKYPDLDFKILFLSSKGKFQEGKIIGIDIPEDTDFTNSSACDILKDHLVFNVKYLHQYL